MVCRMNNIAFAYTCIIGLTSVPRVMIPLMFINFPIQLDFTSRIGTDLVSELVLKYISNRRLKT